MRLRLGVLAAVVAIAGCNSAAGPHGGMPDGNVLPLDGGTSGFAHLVFNVIDGDTGLPVPSRVIFRPVPGAGFADSITSGTFDPQSPGSLTGAVVGPGVIGSPEGVMLSSGLGVVPVPSGTYTLFITRGPEYEAVELPVTLDAGEERNITATLDRSVDTRGWLAADMHVHLARSFDSMLRIERRAVAMVSNGVEIIVPTDHNVSTDIAPTLTDLGYGPELVGSVVGNEFSFQDGHAGAYPVPFDATAPNGGAPIYQDPCTGTLVGVNCFHDVDAFPMMHAQVAGSTVVTLNHPYWAGADLGYFTNIAWGAGTANPLPAALRSAGLFDAMEVLNGYQVGAAALNNLTADWFFLLGQGLRVTALGNSDTHKINWVRSGWPRTWLRLANDRPGDTTGAALADAIRNGRAVASTGPFITFTADGAQIGDVVAPKIPGRVTVAITVDAPGWITVDTVHVYVDGVEKHKFTVTPGQRPVFQTSFVEPFTSDGWIVVQATGATPLPPDVVGEYSNVNGYQMLPWAITNPIFIDANGDGRVRPPPSPARGQGRRDRPSPFGGEVPVGCDPSEQIGTEPTLAAERVLMPLLYP